MSTDYLFDPKRIAALRKSGFLDSQEKFSEIATQAAFKLEADICQINALTGEVQNTVACFPFTEYASLPVEDTGCQVPIATGETFVVDKTETHPITCSMVWTEWVKSYLGSPIFYQGEAVGTICVLRKEERGWTPEDVEVLESMAERIGKELESKPS